MSLSLNSGTIPAGLNVSTFGYGPIGNTVYLGDYEISLEDFLKAALYVLTNADLEPNDPRLQFVKCVQSMKRKPMATIQARRVLRSHIFRWKCFHQISVGIVPSPKASCRKSTRGFLFIYFLIFYWNSFKIRLNWPQK